MTKYNSWPLGKLNSKFLRPELELIKKKGYSWKDPRDVVDMFEKKVAKFAGSKYAVSCDCCSHGIFLSLKYLNSKDIITIPNHSYLSIPMQILHAGSKVRFKYDEWSGIYQLKPYPVFDGAVRWTKNMYKGGLHVLSFQIKKRIPIGRGGMILTDSIRAYNWLKKASYDGRNLKKDYMKDKITFLGYHFYMTPEDAARGLLLMDMQPKINEESGNFNNYYDLSKIKLFN
jgi:dTDP-4-amino-4,6-dideoxygalactose transaminase